MSILFKAAAGAVAALGFSGAAIAGPYVNIENNAGYSGSDWNAAITDFHVGYEGSISESAGYYVQAGPAIVSVDGLDSTTEFSGKAGLGVDVSDRVNVYGEISFLTVDGQDDNNYGTKLGIKYSF